MKLHSILFFIILATSCIANAHDVTDDELSTHIKCTFIDPNKSPFLQMMLEKYKNDWQEWIRTDMECPVKKAEKARREAFLESDENVYNTLTKPRIYKTYDETTKKLAEEKRVTHCYKDLQEKTEDPFCKKMARYIEVVATKAALKKWWCFHHTLYGNCKSTELELNEKEKQYIETGKIDLGQK